MKNFSILPGFWRSTSDKVVGGLDLKKAVKYILKSLNVSYSDTCCGDSFTGSAAVTIPAATTAAVGGVKKAAAITATAPVAAAGATPTKAEYDALVAYVNELKAKLTAAGSAT